MTIKQKVYILLHLSILVFYVFRPVLPFIEYAINKNYIAKNLCINKDKPKSCCKGKCYLKKQLAKSSASGDAESKDTNKKTQNRQLEEFVVNQPGISEFTETNLQYLIFSNSKITKLAIAAIFVPPKAPFTL
jgi:hypothetical protein